MKPSAIQIVLRHVSKLSSNSSTISDLELVRRFVETRDDEVFSEIVNRHGAMVWSVCRQMLMNQADAEDAFQATFLAFVCSAKSVRSGTSLGGWLHGVAVRIVQKLRRSAVRRKQREQRVAGNEVDRSVPDLNWDSLLSAVHEEVDKLPESLRTAFVLCDLEGVRQEDAALRLGWKPGTLTGRLCRARQILMRQLSERGLAPLVAAGFVGISTAQSSMVPFALVEKVMSNLKYAADGVVPPDWVNLTEGIVPMTLTRIKLAMATFILAGSFSLAIGTGLIPGVAAQPEPAGSRLPSRDQYRAPETFRPDANSADPLATVEEGPPRDQPPVGNAPDSRGPGMVFPGMIQSVNQRSQWEYLFAAKSANFLEFVKLTTDYGLSGWELVGLTECDLTNELLRAVKEKKANYDKNLLTLDKSPVTIAIFKRPKQGISGWSVGIPPFSGPANPAAAGQGPNPFPRGTNSTGPRTGGLPPGGAGPAMGGPGGTIAPGGQGPSGGAPGGMGGAPGGRGAPGGVGGIGGAPGGMGGAPGGRGAPGGVGGIGGAPGGMGSTMPDQLWPLVGNAGSDLPKEEKKLHLVELKHANAADLGTLISQIFSDDKSIKVMSDLRTNKLMLLCSPKMAEAILEVVKKLDVSAPEVKKIPPPTPLTNSNSIPPRE